MRETPLLLVEPAGHRPFWLITKNADIREISRQPKKFSSQPISSLVTLEQEQMLFSVADPFLRMLTDMDGADHRHHRMLAQEWFMPANLQRLEGQLTTLAKDFVDRMQLADGRCDFVTDIAAWYPLRVIMTILGVPPEDEARMLRMTRAFFGAADDHSGDTSASEKFIAALQNFGSYFGPLAEDRRRHPTDDLATVLANAEIGEVELLSYFVIIATAGHDTTSGTIAGGLHALIQNPDQMAKLRANPDLLDTAIEEMLRWTTPVKHFIRTATQDYELRGQVIRAGQSVMLLYPSGNRDEETFGDPFAFRVDRTPNPHLAFGFGAHTCLGMHLARMEIRALFRELLARVDEIALDGEPEQLLARHVSCLTSLPIRYTMRERMLEDA